MQNEDIELSTHTGTHMDAPCHFSKGKWCISDIPLEHLVNRPLVVVDVSESVYNDRDYEITVQDLTNWEDIYGRIPDGAVIMFRTGWGRFWPIQDQYFGTETADTKLVHFPGIHPRTAAWIVENRSIVGLGIEGPSVDKGQSEAYQTHVLLAAQNIFFLENVSYQIRQLPPIGATLTVMPMKLEAASGAPVRILAMMRPLTTSASTKAMPSFYGLALLLLLSEALSFC